MNDFYKFFNYNWFKIIKNNIKNNKTIQINKKEKIELSNLIFKKEICALVFVLINFLITYVSSREAYKINYKNLVLFRIIKDNISISLFWFITLTILPILTIFIIRKNIKSKYYIIICIIYLFSNIFNVLMTIYFTTAFINTKILGIIGLVNIILTLIINSKIIIKLKENYLK